MAYDMIRDDCLFCELEAQELFCYLDANSQAKRDLSDFGEYAFQISYFQIFYSKIINTK